MGDLAHKTGQEAKAFLARKSDLPTLRRMDPLLKLLHENAALKSAQLAALLNTTEAEVTAKVKAYEADEVILGYRAVLNEEKLGRDIVRARSEERRVGKE